MMDRLSGRAAILISAAGLIVILLVGWFALLAPQRAKVAELEGEINRAQLQLDATQALINSPALEQSGRELSRLRTAIPDEVSMPEILRQLARAAADARVRITAIAPQPVVQGGIAETVPLNVNLEGRYAHLREFLRLLRTRAALDGEELRATGRLFSVESIQFGGGGEAAGAMIQATLALSAYAFSGAVAPAPGATAQTTDEPAAEAASG